MLNKFYAVTMTSVYEVVANGGNGSPSAKKIKLFGQSVAKQGQVIGGGSMLSIGYTLTFYTPTGNERGIDYSRSIGWNTSRIVALFKKENDALMCSEQKNLEIYDARWTDETEKILAEIGPSHPVFTITDRN